MKVSVVVATRNAGNTLDRCLASVRGQNFDDIEIVVVDNSSTDDTLDVARRFADVVLLGGPERSSQRNTGAVASSGDVLLFVDADMVLEPGVVREAVGRLRSTDASGVVIPELSFGEGFWARCKGLEKQLAMNDPAVEAARAFRRRDFEAVGGYDAALTACEDWDLADRIAAADEERPTERTDALIWHDEGRLRLRGTFRKKRYYGRWVSHWLETAPAHRRRRAVGARTGALLRHPITAVGLVLMKTVEALGFAAGMRDARRVGDRTSASRPPAGGRDRDRVGVAIAASAAIAATIVQSWFTFGSFVSSGDNGPWMRGLSGATRAWGDSLVGTGSTGYPSASLIDGAAHDLFVALGMGEPMAQRVWYSMLFAMCAASVAYLAAAFTRRPVAVFVAGLVAVIAPFHITTLPNILPIAAISSIGMIIGILARLGRPNDLVVPGLRASSSRWVVDRHGSRSVPPATGAFVAVWMSHLAKNPPLLVLLLAVTAIAALVTVVHDRSTLPRIVRFAAWFVAGSLFWVVPLGLHYALGTPGLQIVAQRNVDAWSWAQRHSGPANTATLVASWVWGDRDILTATAALAKAPWSYLRWGLPVGALLSVPLALNRRLSASLGVIGAVMIVLCVGINAPFAAVNRLLFDHVPGFWLYRQPMSKFGVVLVVVYAVLIALGLDGLLARAPAWRAPLRHGGGVLAAAMLVAALAFAHPLYDGTVIPGQRGGTAALPPARVKVPSSWYAAGRWLDRAPLPGSVMVLPLSEYYQRGTTWGYYGVDDLMWRITSRPSLYLLPGGYYAPAGAAPELMAALEDAVAARDDIAVRRLMDVLGVSYLAIRTDYVHTAGRTFRDGRELIADADAMAGLDAVKSFEHVRIFDAAADLTAPTGVSPTAVSLADASPELDPALLADVIAALPPTSHLVADDGQPGTADAWRPVDGESVRAVPNVTGDYRFTARPRSPLVWRAVPFTSGGSAGVDVSLVSNMAVDGRPIIDAPVTTLRSDRKILGLLVDGRMVPLGSSPALFEAVGGTDVRLLVEGRSVGLGDAFAAGDIELGNCNNRDKVSLQEAGIDARFVAGGVRLTADTDSACLAVALPEALTSAPGADGWPLGRAVWQVHTDFERSSGPSTRVCLWMPAARRCALGNPAATADAHASFDFVAAPPDAEPGTIRDAKLMLYADQAGPGQPSAAAFFSNVSVSAIEPDGAAAALPSVGTTSVVMPVAAGTTALAAAPELTANLLGFMAPTVADCHDYDSAPDAEVGLSARTLTGEAAQALELAAVRHSACVNGRVEVPAGLRHVTVDFEYRTPSGSGGRWCLMGSTHTCIATGPLDPSPTWEPFRRDVVLPAFDPTDPQTVGDYRLYLYSDGASEGQPSRGRVVTQYRSVSIRPTYPLVAVAAPVAVGTTHLVTNHQAYAEGWTLDGLGEGVTARHEMVDGWANGWLLRGPRVDDGAGELRFRYGPDVVSSIAVWSLVPLLLLAVVVATRFRLRQRRTV